jgi:hypothetical protein
LTLGKGDQQMNPNKELIDTVGTVISHFKWEVMWVLFKSSFAVMVIMALYNMFKTFVAYVSFRANRDIGKNVKLVIKDREAIITHFTMRFIFIRFKDNKNEMIIPMRKWENMDWELIKNGFTAPEK